MIRTEVLEEAELIVHEGGEIPEVAFWNAWFYLTGAPPEGLGLVLRVEEEATLREAVIRRYILIIERDLRVENMNKSFYRGPERARINWNRLCRFLKRHGYPLNGYRRRVRTLVEAFWAELPEGHPLKEETQKFREELAEGG
ncbi:hypothetical protein [Thermosulfurimonas sp. F29]|uniref:hypothetical protein n=1 Tax=Thermosulfurimonas sp. F29 TaxID=2867247 RepID=UPI001C836066|nr:hypothetical protein [Thermosulfurimonas sp. F29]MBX6422485.1 hypothetical protein [Thermosulfurimonas sp. F29]